MEISRQSNGVLRLGGDLHIGDVEALRSALLMELAASPALELELSGVERCDTASLQILCSLGRSADRDGKGLRLHGTPAALSEPGAILGLSLESLA
jgi:anti-anti-sigma regulatory factor